MTLLGLAGSSSVSFRASHTAEYEIFVWSLMIVCSASRRASPCSPMASA